MHCAAKQQVKTDITENREEKEGENTRYTLGLLVCFVAVWQQKLLVVVSWHGKGKL